jgi:hypothetical protein
VDGEKKTDGTNSDTNNGMTRCGRRKENGLTKLGQQQSDDEMWTEKRKRIEQTQTRTIGRENVQEEKPGLTKLGQQQSDDKMWTEKRKRMEQTRTTTIG